MKPVPFPGTHWLADHLLVGDADAASVELTPAALRELFAVGVRAVVHLLSKEQFLAAGADTIFGPMAEVLGGLDLVASPKLELHYCFWPLADETPPTARQIRSVVDAIERARRAGLPVFLHGAGNPARVWLAADCWLTHQRSSSDPSPSSTPTPTRENALKMYRATDRTYGRTATEAARQAVQEWLQHVDRRSMQLFEVDGVECALEFFAGHWEGVAPYGMAEGGRWRWGRVDAGDPDEDESGEDVLLDVALGRTLSADPATGRRRPAFPPFSDAELTTAAIRTHALARAEENLSRLVLRHFPRA